MRGTGRSLAVLTRARFVRGATAVSLAFTVAATGFVALAAPSQAATAPQITSSPTSPSKDPSPRWTFDTSTAPAFECAFTLATAAPSFSPCPANGVYDAPARASDGSDDGTYTFRVREPGAAAAVTATSSYTLDTLGRVSVVVAARTNDATPTWTISPEPGTPTLTSCRLDGTNVTCPTNGTFTPSSPLADGSHTLTVTIVDDLGNNGSGAATTTVDTVAPAAPTVTGSSGLHNTGSVSWSWATQSPSDTSSCAFTTPSGVTTVAGCTSPFTRGTASDGSYSLAVTLTDAAGNEGPSGSSSVYTLDTVAPAAPVFSSQPTGTSQAARPTWTFSTPAASTTCTLTGPTVVPATTCTSGSFTPSTNLADGVWTLTVTSVSPAGNTANVVSGPYTVDRTGPSAPTVSLPDAATPHNATSPQFSWNGEMPVTAFCRTVRTDSTGTVTRSAYVGCDGRVYTAVVNGDADYQVEAYLVDPSGNTGATGISARWAFDATPPPAPVLGGVPAMGHDKTVTFSFTPESGATALCWYTPQGGGDSAKTACNGGTYVVTFPADGTYTIHAQQQDAATNLSAVGDATYDLNTALPSAPTITAPVSPGNTSTVTWTLQPNDASTLTCRLLTGAGAVLDGPVSCPSQYVATLSSDGTYALEVTATNSYGSTRTLSSTYVLDRVAPAQVTVTGPVSPGNSTTPTWTFPVQGGTTAQCRLVHDLSSSAWSDCSGSFAPGALADGTYTVDVQVFDLAGNTPGIASSAPYTSDRTAPAAPVVVSPSSPGRDPMASWTYTGETGATATCRLDKDGGIGTAAPCGTTSGSFAPGLTGDGSYVLVVQLTDPAGNTSIATTSAAYVLDTTAPVTPTVTGSQGTSSVGTASWSFPVEAGGRAECALSDSSGAALVFAACTSGATVTLPRDGQYRLVVHTVDQAGNQSADGTGPLYTYDSTKPGTPSVAGPAVSPSTDPSPTYTFSAESAALVECHVLRSGALVKDWFTCASPVTIDLSGEVDGSYVVEVRATDAAGNVSDAGSALPYVLDRTGPAAFAVSGPSGPSSGPSPSFSWPATEPGLTSTCQLFRGTAADPSVVSCTSPYAPTLTVDGTWSLHVTTTDQAGNATTAISGGYEFDTTPPTQPVVHSPPSPGRDTKPSWSVDVETGSTQQCRVTTDTGSVVRDWAACTLPVTTDLTGLTDGTYVLNVQSTDHVGLQSTVGSASYTLDSQAPDAPLLTLRTRSPGSARMVSFAVSTEPGATVVCQLTRGTTVLSTQSDCASASSISLASLPEGPYAIAATATDRAGNTSASSSITYVLDVTPPATPVLTSAPPMTSSDRTPVWTFTPEAGATVSCSLSGSNGFSLGGIDCSRGGYAPDLTSAPDDTYTFSATVTDAAGNVQRVPLTGTYVLDSTAPAGPSALPLTTPGNNPTVSWSVSSAGERLVCSVTRTVSGTVVFSKPFADCGSPFTITLPDDGAYVFSAHTIDAAGNASGDITATYRLDTKAPSPARVTAPVSPSSGRSPQWTLASTEMNASATCSVTGPGGIPFVPAAPCQVSSAGTPYSLALTSKDVIDGPYTLTVHLVDSAGNANTSDAVSTYVLDTGAPNAVLVTPPPTPSSMRTPKWALVGDADATLECRLASDSSPGIFAACAADPFVPGSGSFTADLTSKPDGTYTLTVRSRDSAGNVGPEVTSGYTLDTVKPAVPTVPVTGPSPSQVSVVTWTFTVEPGATAFCTLSAAKPVAPEQVCTSPWVTDLGQNDGDYSLSVRAQDKAGNSSAGVSAHYVLDRTPPAQPLITSSPGSPSPLPTPSWGVRASDAKDLLECELAGIPTPVWARCADPVSFDLAPAKEGTFRLLVRETDAAGNVSAVATSPDYVLDPLASASPVVTPPAVQRSNNTKPVFVVSRAEGDTANKVLQCSVTRADGKASTATPCAYGPTTIDLQDASFDGAVTLSVASVDSAGKLSGAGMATYSFDDLPPATPSLLGPDPSSSFDRTAEFTFGDVMDADHFVCELRKAGQSGVLPLTLCASPDRVTFPSFGSYAFSVWAVDKAGNRSYAPESFTYSYLTPVPSVTGIKGPTSGSDETPTWTFTLPTGYTAECLLGLPGGQALSYPCTTPVAAARSVGLPGQALFAANASRASSFTANLEGRPAGTYSLSVRLTDAFGNLGDFGSRVTYRYTPATGPGRITPQPVTPFLPPTDDDPPVVVITPNAHPDPGPVPATGAGGLGDDRPTPRVTAGAPSKGVTKSALPGLHIPSPIPLTQVPSKIGSAISDLSQKPTIPLLLLVIVVGFLLLQNQIDRRDPKLASAPVGAEPEMEFGPVLGAQSGRRGLAPGPSGPLSQGGGAPA